MNFFKRIFHKNDLAANESSEFKALIEGSMVGLQLQTAAHQGTWHLGEEENWDFSQDTGELSFTFPNVIVRTQAQIIGTFDSLSKTWMWAWANPSIEKSLVKNSLQVKEYGEKNAIQRLTLPKWPSKAEAAWQMTALANRLCESNGAYRGPAGSTFVYMTFGKVQIKQK